MMHLDLTTVWAIIIAFAVFMYVVMDGFDLGIGILFPIFSKGDERDQAMNAIAPVWDGNETWLVLGGGGLLAAFPLAYAIILPATLSAGHRHAAGVGLPRRRVRIPGARSAAMSPSGTSHFSRARWLRPSRKARSLGRSSKASLLKAAIMPAAGMNGCRLTRFSRVQA